MKGDKKESDEELIDIDEKGNPIEKEKEGKNSKPNNSYKIIIAIILCLILLISCYLFFSNKKVIRVSLMKQI